MRYIDCHVHMSALPKGLDECLRGMDKAGVEATAIYSLEPVSQGSKMPEGALKTAWEKLDQVLEWGQKSDRIIPIHWIDPMEEDALKQVDAAVEGGIAGFKCICDSYYPCDERPMEVWNYIAQKGKPIIFHSGILYCARLASQYNRPVYFEKLMSIPNLKFSLAHVSWPWYDECIALFGHWSYRYNYMRDITAEMFIDTTPGSPALYRKDMLEKAFRIYDTTDNIMWGTDCSSEYSGEYATSIYTRDTDIFNMLGVTEEQREKYYHKNFLRFLGR